MGPRSDSLIQNPLTCDSLIAQLIGNVHCEPSSFFYGGGTRPWRHLFALYRGMFNDETKTTTLLGLGGEFIWRLSSAPPPDLTSPRSTPFHPAPLLEPISLAAWADVAIDEHDPFAVDVFSYPAVGDADKVKETCAVLNLVAGCDRVVPRSQSEEISKLWGVEQVVVEGQGHELGDEGWETAVMEPIVEFLEGLL